jgi:hypothetical protein
MTVVKRRKLKDDAFGISAAWGEFMVSGMQHDIDEVFRLVHVAEKVTKLEAENKRLRAAILTATDAIKRGAKDVALVAFLKMENDKK